MSSPMYFTDTYTAVPFYLVSVTKTERLVVYVLYLQPAVEIISFRLTELRGLARWRSRFQIIGLDEKLMDGVTESIGMLVVQVERFSRVAATVLYLVQFIFLLHISMPPFRLVLMSYVLPKIDQFLLMFRVW